MEEEKKGTALGRIASAPFKVVGRVTGAVGKAVGKTISKGVGLFSPGAEEWLNKTGSNLVNGVKNKINGIKNQPFLGEISTLKKQLTNMIIKFVSSLQKKLVKEAKQNGKEIAENKVDSPNRLNNKLSSANKSADNLELSEDDLVKNSLQKEQGSMSKVTTQSKGKSIDGLLANAKNRSDAINKTNKEFGLGGDGTVTRGLGRQ